MRRTFVMPALIALGLAAPAMAADPAPPSPSPSPFLSDTAAPIVGKAGELVAQRRPAEALAMLGAAIETFDKRVEAASERGEAYCATSLAEGQLYMSFAQSKQTRVVVFPGSLCNALFLKAYVLSELKREDEAVETLEKLTALAPMNAHYFVELGYAYRMLGEAEKSMQSYQQAVAHAQWPGKEEASIKLDRARALRGIGYLLIDKHDLDGAAEAYRKSLADDPGSALARSELVYIEGLRRRSR